MYIVKYNNKEYQFEENITLKDLAKKFGVEAYVAKVNNRLRELNFYLNFNYSRIS